METHPFHRAPRRHSKFPVVFGLATSVLLVFLALARGAPAAAQGSVYVAPAGNDGSCIRGDQTKPCASFNRAYQLARCGDTVLVGAGTYSPQLLGFDRSKSCTSYVTFQPVTGAQVVVASPASPGTALRVGSIGDGISGARWVRLKNMTITGDYIVYSTDHVAFVGLQAGGGTVRFATNFLIDGGSYGPCQTEAFQNRTTSCSSNMMFDGDPDESHGASAINTVTIRNATIHDFQSWTDDHFECMFLHSAARVLIENDRFYNCHIYDIFIQGGGNLANITIRGNWFGYTGGGFPDNPARESAISPGPADGVLIQNNSFLDGQGLWIDQQPAANLMIVGNIFGVPGDGDGCRAGTYSGNFWKSAGCGPTDTSTVPFGFVAGNGKLVPVRGAVAAVQEIFRQAAAGATLQTLIIRLRKAHMAAPAGRRWTGASVLKVLGDRIYLGRLFGAPGAQPALITKTRWNAACHRKIRCTGPR